ncbi:MAG: nucleotidyltransferase family protein [Ruminococcus sp.]|nr:nucleotidyltransferase family protein [Ruminococcus sp.]
MTAGVVCEFDPFHNGHKYLLEKIRQSGYSHIACVMSGDFVQRGGIAIDDKFSRALSALKGGADIIAELPPPFSCSCSEVFAMSAVRLLISLGVDTIAFGSETDDKELLLRCAEISKAIENKSDIKALLSKGLSYPRAVYEYVKDKYGQEYSKVFESPNATLGIEYIKAAKSISDKVDIMPVLRTGAEHNSNEIKGDIVSASLIRQRVLSGEDYQKFIPGGSIITHPADINKMTEHILFKMCTISREEMLRCPDCSEALADRITALKKKGPRSLDELFTSLKCKGLTLARIRRVILFLSAGLENASADELTAARILAFNSRGREILSGCGGDVTFDTSLARIERKVPKIVQNINRASYLRYLCTDKSVNYQNEYTKRILMTE